MVFTLSSITNVTKYYFAQFILTWHFTGGLKATEGSSIMLISLAKPSSTSIVCKCGLGLAQMFKKPEAKKKNVFCIHLHSFQCFLAKMRKGTPIPAKVFNSALFIKWRREKKSLGPEIKQLHNVFNFKMWKYSNAVKISRAFSLLKAKQTKP